jgi:hypothetical protein
MDESDSIEKVETGFEMDSSEQNTTEPEPEQNTTEPEQNTTESKSTEPDTTKRYVSEAELENTRIIDKNMALNFMVVFLMLAQKRGTFSNIETKKIMECINLFQN